MSLELSKEKAEKVLETFRKALEIYEKIKECADGELSGFLKGISGAYIEPGPSGSITRGKIEVLPTGKNFLAVDPSSLPTKSAWKVGVEAANKLLEHYIEKHGRYPETVGEVLWSIDAYKADGEQLAQILYLMGVKPNSGKLEVIPLDELGRPRIDVSVRISGIVRDTLPNYVHMIDEAVAKVVMLDEPPEMNFVRKHYLEHLRKLSELGISKDFARCRIWGPPPGAYGAGVNYAIEASAWRNDEDLANVYVQWSAYGYTREFYGKKAVEAFLLNLKTVDVVTRNHPSDEHDLTNCCGYFAQHGGFYATVKQLRGEVEICITDTTDASETKVREIREEIERISRAKILNPLWIEEMKKHGYRGANEFSKKILHLYGWSATTRLVDDWIFEEIAEKYILDEEMRKFFEENNVYALEEIVRRLIEANERGIWNAREEQLRRLREIYGEIEGILEDEIAGDVQGSAVEFLSPQDVDEWGEKISDVLKAWRLVK